jgi:hypothetical protein
MQRSALHVARTLRHQRMPFAEIRAILTTDDPVVIRRYLELHRERLREWFEEERGTLVDLEHEIVPSPHDLVP